ncbi:MAG: radical SAM family heme chaperone HemW [Syntrophales bacterium]|jgi:oxygen-independent coproporphyrinogen III oxidase
MESSIDISTKDTTPGLYVHIPFCKSKCPYCNFYSVTSFTMIDEFLHALFREMEMYREAFTRFDTVYIGGGTPSLLAIKQFDSILSNIRNSFVLSPNAEITVEINPADSPQAYLESLRRLGCNRLDIGVQSFDDKVLTFLKRRHSVREALDTIKAARNARFENIGIDLIYGIPGQDMTSWLDTVSKALFFNLAHLSCYQLTIEADTPLGLRHQRREIVLPDEELQHAFFIKTSEILENAGYVHYEVSNFARDISLASKHNQKYWNHASYLGLGPAAHSFMGHKRWWNHRSLEEYIRDIEAGRLPLDSSEILTREQLRLEAFFLGLRTKKGIHLHNYSHRYGYDLVSEKADTLARLVKAGFIEIKEGYLHPTRSGLAVADSLVSTLAF